MKFLKFGATYVPETAIANVQIVPVDSKFRVVVKTITGETIQSEDLESEGAAQATMYPVVGSDVRKLQGAWSDSGKSFTMKE